MGQYLDANGNQTSDPAKAAKDPKIGKPVPNQARDVWVTYTALSTALNTSFFPKTVGVFGIVMGIALLLVGIGFLVLTLGVIEQKPAADAAPRGGQHLSSDSARGWGKSRTAVQRRR